jgi:hypothetical protein
MHLDEEQLQRFLHRELDADVRRSAAEHLATCVECRDRLFELERDQKEVHRLLARVDSPPPEVTAHQIAARARGSDPAWGKWAAGILLAAALAGGAYAMPGSPLREWAREAREWIGGTEPPPRPLAPPMPVMAGLAVPAGDRLFILFGRSQPRSRVRVSIGDWTEVRVRGPSGGATFGSEADTLRVDNRDSTGTFEVEIPRQAPRVEIRVMDRRIFLKDGARIEPASDLLPLTAP